MTDKEPLNPECTLAAGSLLEVCQELNSKAPTDIIQLIHAWNEQVGWIQIRYFLLTGKW